MADMKYGRLFTEDDVMAFAFLMSGIHHRRGDSTMRHRREEIQWP